MAMREIWSANYGENLAIGREGEFLTPIFQVTRPKNLAQIIKFAINFFFFFLILMLSFSTSASISVWIRSHINYIPLIQTVYFLFVLDSG